LGIFHFDLVDMPRNYAENQLVPLVFTKDGNFSISPGNSDASASDSFLGSSRISGESLFRKYTELKVFEISVTKS
jgi:hypothetical protein